MSHVLLILVALSFTLWMVLPLVRGYWRKQQEGWQLVGWRRMGRSEYELRFRNGTVVRDMKLYPSGYSLSGSSIWERCWNLQQQIKCG